MQMALVCRLLLHSWPLNMKEEGQHTTSVL